MADASQTTDPIGDAIRELVDLNDLNDHISMRAILVVLAATQRAEGFQDGARWVEEIIRGR